MYIYFVGSIFVVSYLSDFFEKINLTRLLVLGAFSLYLLTGIIYAVYKNEQATLFQVQPPELTCLQEKIDNYNLDKGLGDFWNAKQNFIFSDGEINIIQVETDFSYYHWNNNASYIDGESLDYEDYDFVMTKNLSREEIVEELGEPRAVETCPYDETIFIY
jgi:hypothetical protein